MPSLPFLQPCRCIMASSYFRPTSLPTPLAGLALGIGSLGWCLENTGLFTGMAATTGAILSGILLALLLVKFLRAPNLLKDELKHPVIGSILPTYSMALMLVSAAIGGRIGTGLWLVAVGLHIILLLFFFWERGKSFRLPQLVPSWYIPPVGIIVADLTIPGGSWAGLAMGLFWFGLISYAIMLPVMMYRLIFGPEVPDAAKPTIAILAAPASLSLAGYLAVSPAPSVLLVMILLGIAMLMTAITYLGFIRLLRLPFSPGYASFTFPMVIGATALFKSVPFLAQWGASDGTVATLLWLARLELIGATLVVGYVCWCYARFFLAKQAKPANNH